MSETAAGPAPTADVTTDDSTVHWVEGSLDGMRPVAWWQAPGVVLSPAAGDRSRTRLWRVRARTDDGATTQLYLALRQDPQGKARFLIQGSDILLVAEGDTTLGPALLRPAAILTVLRREWLLSLFLFGPILGVFLVDLIFGMPSFLWWSALGVLILSLAVMSSLIRKDLKELRAWVEHRRKRADAASRMFDSAPTPH